MNVSPGSTHVGSGDFFVAAFSTSISNVPMMVVCLEHRGSRMPVLLALIGLLVGTPVDLSANESDTTGSSAEDAPEARRQPNQYKGPAPVPSDPFWTWDLNLDFGVGNQAGDWGVTGSARTGVTYSFKPTALSAGVIGELGTLNRPAVGLELEALSLSRGVFAQLGGLVNVRGDPTATLSVGFYTWAVEVQYQPTPDYGRDSRWVIMGQLNLPVSWVIRSFTR